MEVSCGPRDGWRGPGHLAESPQRRPQKKRKRDGWGPNCSLLSEERRGSGVLCSRELRKTKITTHAVSSSPTNWISKMCSGASKVLVTSFISLFTLKLSLKLSTQKQSLETDWLCVHRNTNTTRYVLVGLL